jgi:peptidyl-prolyl cis-trans isomerase SurA
LKYRAAITAAVLACVMLAGCKKQVTAGPDVWAVVDGKEIHRAEVEKYFRSRINPEGPPPSQEEALSLKLSILDELINNEILLEHANKLSLGASDAEVEDKFTESKNPYTEEEFQRKLRDSGISVDDLKAELRREVSIQKLINREIISKITVTDQDVIDFYNQNRAQFNLAEPRFHLAQIVVTPRPDPTVHNRKNDKSTNDADARRKAALLEEKLNTGADFSQLAMDYSEDNSASTGGDLGFIPESSFNQSDPALKKAAMALKPGEVSQPVAVRTGGYVIVKMLAKELAGQRELSDPQVQQAIRDTLRNRKEQLLRMAFLTEARDNAQVINYLARQVLESAAKLPSPEPSKQP